MKINCVFVIVLYKETLTESKAFQTLRDAGATNFYIFDNSPNVSQIINADSVKIKYFHNPNNPGLSQTYNLAAIYAKKDNYEWMFISDQDTLYPSSILKEYSTAITEHPEVNLFLPKVKVFNGLFMSPVRVYHYFTKLSSAAPSGLIDPKKYGIINSGILVKIYAFEAVGGYNDKVWLDFSDFQFIERFSSKYDKAYVINSTCTQSFSDNDHNIYQKQQRFRRFCTSLKYYQPIKKYKKFWLHIIVIRRMLSLCIQSKNFKPFWIFINEYL